MSDNKLPLYRVIKSSNGLNSLGYLIFHSTFSAPAIILVFMLNNQVGGGIKFLIECSTLYHHIHNP